MYVEKRLNGVTQKYFIYLEENATETVFVHLVSRLLHLHCN